MRSLILLAIAIAALGAHAAAQDRRSPPTVLCGTTIMSADPKIDSKAVKPAPRGQFTLRVVQPRVCAPRAVAQRTIGDRLPQIFGPRR
jgi:hypothetical protein